MCSSICGYFLCRVCTRRCALAVGQIRIGIAISLPFKARAPRAVVEVCTSKVALLGEENGNLIVPPLTRARRCGAPFVLGRPMDSGSF